MKSVRGKMVQSRQYQDLSTRARREVSMNPATTLKGLLSSLADIEEPEEHHELFTALASMGE